MSKKFPDENSYDGRNFSAMRIGSVRRAAKLSRKDFAMVLNVTIGTVRAWEDGKTEPVGAEVAALELIERSSRLIHLRHAELTDDIGPWRIRLRNVDIQRLHNSETFIDALVLGRFTSALRSLMQADDGYEHDEHPARWRARWGSFIFAAGILNEAIPFLDYLAGRYKTRAAWREGFALVLRDIPIWFRKYLETVRNKGAFHFDDRAVIRDRLGHLAQQPNEIQFDFDFKRGEGELAQSTYYAFVDLLIVMGAMEGTEQVSNWSRIAVRYLTQMGTTIAAFVTAADQLMLDLIQDCHLHPIHGRGEL